MREFGAIINRLIQKKDLTRTEACEAFRKILMDEQPSMQQGAFLAAMTAKGATPEEIAGVWEAIYKYDTVKVKPSISRPLVENCGTGMDELDTFNISTVASIIAAANGVFMAKHGARAITSKHGAVDILEAVGIEVECDPEVVRRSIERAGIGVFNGMSPKIHPRLARILSQIYFGTFLNIAASLANPALPRYGVRGVYSKDLVKPVVEIMKEIGYRRAIVVHGMNSNGTKGMDEISIMGSTIVAELHEDGKISTYLLTPEDFGIQQVGEAELSPEAEREREALRFLRTLGGMEMEPRTDIACINASPILYLAGKARDLKEGFEISKETVKSGKALEKLKEWVREQNSNSEKGLEKLESLMEKIK